MTFKIYLLDTLLQLNLYSPQSNPYTPSIIFVGQRQTVQTQIRRHRMQCLIMSPQFAYRMLYQNLHKNKKKKTSNPYNRNGLVRLIIAVNSIRLKQIKIRSLDLDECSRWGNYCPQLCNNVKGSFKCQCADGFKDDKGQGRECKSEGTSTYMSYIETSLLCVSLISKLITMSM